MTRSNFSGVWTALATPFQADGSIDWKAFEKLVTLQAEASVAGLVICGTTGEAPTLDDSEKLELIRRARQYGSGLPIMAGTGGNDTAKTLRLSEQALEAGAASLLVVTPPYNKPSQAGLEAHFQAVADKFKVPICLYHVPGRTAHKLSVESICRLSRIDMVQVVKEASADLALFAKVADQADATIVSGDDPTTLASLSIGGQGCISVLSNLYPKAWRLMHEAFWNGDYRRAAQLNAAMMPVVDSLFCETNPTPLKAALAIRKLADDTLRLPLVRVEPESYKQIALALSETDQRLKDLN